MCLGFLQEKEFEFIFKIKTFGLVLQHSVKFYTDGLVLQHSVQFYNIRFSFTNIRFSFTIFGLVLIHSVQFYNIRFSFTIFGLDLQIRFSFTDKKNHSTLRVLQKIQNIFGSVQVALGDTFRLSSSMQYQGDFRNCLNLPYIVTSQKIEIAYVFSNIKKESLYAFSALIKIICCPASQR